MINKIQSILFVIGLITTISLYSEDADSRTVKYQVAIKRWEQLRAIAENSAPISLSEAVRELITEITEPYFDEETVKKIAQMEKSTESGEYVEFWENGKRKLRGAFKKGLAEGHIHGWYPDGSDAFKGFFEDGVKQGIHMAFFPRKKMEGHETNYGRLLVYTRSGKANGEQKTCDIKGRLQSHSKYKKGVLDGPVTFWEDELLEERIYKEGKLVAIKTPFKPIDKSLKTIEPLPSK